MACSDAQGPMAAGLLLAVLDAAHYGDIRVCVEASSNPDLNGPRCEESLGLFWNLNLNVNITGLGMLQAANSFCSGVKISLIHTEAIFPK